MPVTRTSWTARYFDGRTARRQEVSLRITPGGLHFRAEDGSDHVWGFGEIKQTQGRHRGEPIRLERGLEALVLEEPEFLAALAAFRRGSGIQGAKSRPKQAAIILASALGLLAVGIGLMLWGIPTFVKAAASQIPVAWEEKLGAAVTAKIAPLETRSRDPEAIAAVEAMVARLKGDAPSPYTYRVAIVETPTVNALAAPGGHILLYRGLIARAQSPEEVAGVLAHEMAHIERRHATQAVLRELSFTAMLGALTGDARALGQLLEVAGELGSLRYNREAEREADRDGMLRIQEAEIDPRGMVRFFEELQKREGLFLEIEALSTHPPTRERLEAAEALARDWQASARAARPVLTKAQWEALRRAPGEER